MDAEPGERSEDSSLCRIANAIGGTEAAKFRLEAGPERHYQYLEEHVRPDAATPSIRYQAIKAFHEVVRNCTVAGLDGVLCIPDAAGQVPQYCLVHLLREGQRLTAAIAIVVRCKPEEAALRLHQLKTLAD
jgi:hypothetical protein